MKYEVQSKKEGKAVYGSGKIAWNTDGHVYTVNGEASVLFFTYLVRMLRTSDACCFTVKSLDPDQIVHEPRYVAERRFRILSDCS